MRIVQFLRSTTSVASIVLLFLAEMVSRVNCASYCETLLPDTTCITDADCQNYEVNLDETACVNCYIYDTTTNGCGTANDSLPGGVCEFFKQSAVPTVCIVDCSKMTGPTCNSDATCVNYVVDIGNAQCVDCVSLVGGVCNPNLTCAGYIIGSSVPQQCVNCSVQYSGQCNTDPVCLNYAPKPTTSICINCKTDVSGGPTFTAGGDACMDCSIVQSGKCQFSALSGCKNFRVTGPTCFDCGQAVAGVCVHSGQTGCSAFAYDAVSLTCVDCSISTNVGCINSSVPGCNTYRFNGTGICQNCAILSPDQLSCINTSSPFCSSFTYQAAFGVSPASCIDCSLVTSLTTTCTNINAAPGCKHYVYSSVYKICVDCAKVQNSQCINASVTGCLFYRYTTLACVNCSEVSGSACLNSLTDCPNFQYSTSPQISCIDCAQVVDGDCLNKNNPLCATFKFDGLNTCVDCSLATGTSCTNISANGCGNYRYDSSTSKCYDCSQASSGSCTNQSMTGCLMYGYDGSSKCYDCSSSSSSLCQNQSIKGCLNYRYDTLTSKCVDCTSISGTQCANSSVAQCSEFVYDSAGSGCFDCYTNRSDWTDDKCYACFKRANIIIAYKDGTGCKSPYADVTTVTDTTVHSRTLKASLLLLLFMFAFQ